MALTRDWRSLVALRMNAPSETSAMERRATSGLWFGLGAYGLWGVLPIYFKAVDSVGPVEIVAHRIIWSVPFLLLLLIAMRGLPEFRKAIGDRRTMALLAATALLIAVNWLLYVYAVVSGHILAGSLGYYLNPLVNVVMGWLILKERLGPLQWAAVAIAAVGISALAFQAFGQLWISIALALSFATYGLLRKIAAVESVAGLAIETALLLPFALAWLVFAVAAGSKAFGPSSTETALLLGAGIVTTVPLILFTAAARRLRYSTLGMLQFIAPTLQFAIAVAVYGEPFTAAHAVAFGSIWLALALYVVALIRERRSALAAMPPE